MLVALFEVENVKSISEKYTVVLEGISEGVISPGMFYRIPLNKHTVFTVQIDKVIKMPNNITI